MAANNERNEFKELFKSASSGDAEAEEIVTTLGEERGLASVKAYHVYFKDFDLKSFSETIAKWKKKGGVYVNMSMALSAAKKVNEKLENHDRDLAEGDDSKPIVPEPL